MKVGDKVFWTDPENGFASGIGVIVEIGFGEEDDQVTVEPDMMVWVKMADEGEVEAFAHELTVMEPVLCACCQDSGMSPKDSEATHIGAQSTDAGKTVVWQPICDFHARLWNEDTDWNAPVIKLGERVHYSSE